MKNNRGFTLVEMMISVAIFGIVIDWNIPDL